jgi:putative ABC transport system permease protein
VLWQQLLKPLSQLHIKRSADSREKRSRSSICGALTVSFGIFGYAWRGIRNSPGLSTLAIGLLALGVGANLTVFSLADTVLFRPLPYGDPSRLVHVTARHQGQTNLPGCISYAEFVSLRDRSAAFTAMAGYANETFTLSNSRSAVRLEGARISANLFEVLSVKPLVGRSFLSGEDGGGRNQVAMISERLWRQRFGADPHTIGKPISLNLKSHIVVGVLAETFRFELLGTRADIWVPSLPNISGISPHQVQAGACYVNAIARLKAGLSLSSAQRAFRVQQAAFLRNNAASLGADPNRKLEVVALSEKLVASHRPVLLAFGTTVFLFLLIACANVSGLSLARAIVRRKEIAVRVALGATRGDIIAQLLAESSLLAVLGGAAGLLVSLAGGYLTRILFSDALPRLSERNNDGILRLGTLCMLLSAVTGVVCALAPALQVAGSNLNAILRESGRGAVSSRRSVWRNVLVIGQIAASVLLLVSASLLIHSFSLLRDQSRALETPAVLTMNVSLSRSRYSTPGQIENFYSRLVSEIRNLPEVQSVAISSALPLNESRLGHVLAEGQPALPVAQRSLVAVQALSPSYLEVMRIPLVEGRFFTEFDKPEKAKVAVINQAFAKSLFRKRDPIGQRIWLGLVPAPWTVVGVTGDVKNVSLSSPPQAELEIPFEQLPSPEMNLLVRAKGNDGAAVTDMIRKLVERQDREQSVTDVQTLERLVANARSRPRLITTVLTGFAILALVIASVGIYSLISYDAAQRMPEFGLRIALGATRRNLIASVLGRAAAIAGIGIVIGWACALALSRVASAITYGIGRFDPLSFGLAPLTFLLIALLAALYPSLRATRVRPSELLRAE